MHICLSPNSDEIITSENVRIASENMRLITVQNARIFTAEFYVLSDDTGVCFPDDDMTG